MTAEPQELAAGLWRWTARHPEWHPGEFGAEVASFALQAGGGDTLLVDPLLPPEPAPVVDLIERELGDRLSILISIPYHVRNAEEIWKRFRADAEVTIWGHPACRKRLRGEAGFRDLEPGGNVALPTGATAHAIGKPRRHEMPLHLPSHDALVFGDAVVEAGGELRVWSMEPLDAKMKRFYRERFNPTLEPLLELDFDRVLVTHGQPVMRGGRAELERALDAEPLPPRP